MTSDIQEHLVQNHLTNAESYHHFSCSHPQHYHLTPGSPVGKPCLLKKIGPWPLPLPLSVAHPPPPPHRRAWSLNIGSRGFSVAQRFWLTGGFSKAGRGCPSLWALTIPVLGLPQECVGSGEGAG